MSEASSFAESSFHVDHAAALPYVMEKVDQPPSLTDNRPIFEMATAKCT